MARKIFSEDITCKLISERHEGTSHENIWEPSIPGRDSALMCESVECLRVERPCAWYTAEKPAEAKMK